VLFDSKFFRKSLQTKNLKSSLSDSGIRASMRLEVSMNIPSRLITLTAHPVLGKKGALTGLIINSHWIIAILLFILLLCLPSTAMAQTQIGADIDGEAAYDFSGWSVSLSADGGRLAVGAPLNDGPNGPDSGHVRVYQWSDSNWSQVGEDIDGEAAYDESGQSVALSADGKRLAVGAPLNDGPAGFDTGQVRVFEWSDSAWTQLGSEIDGEDAYDESGRSVSLSSDGNRVAIGAVKNDGNGFDSGHVRVYQWSGSAWTQLGADIDGEAIYDESGRSVSFSSDGSRLAVGANRNDGATGMDSIGHARVYHWTGSAWSQLGADIDGESIYDFSGWSVSLSSDGNRLAIGATYNINANGIDSGHVRVYELSGTTWTQLGADIDGEAAYDQSGWSVSLSADGNRLAIGANKADSDSLDSGHTRIYQWADSAWTQIGVDIDGDSISAQSGRSVSLSANGNRLAVGAPEDDGNGLESGHVRVYDLSMFNEFKINPGLNDAWYYKPTDGQGFFITVFPDLGTVSLAWFTYDTELPPDGATANLGDPGHRWLTAIGPIDGNRVEMNITLTSGGIFDTPTEVQRTDPPGSDGTLVVTFDGCNSGTVEYDITSINRQGIIPIKRVADDNIVICEALLNE
jgi:hypothetical protein